MQRYNILSKHLQRNILQTKISHKTNDRLRLGIQPLEIETGRFTPIYDKVLKKNRKR